MAAMKSNSFAFIETCLHDSDSPVDEVAGIDCTDFGSLGIWNIVSMVNKLLLRLQHSMENCVTLCDIRRQNITLTFFDIDCKWAIAVYTQIA